MRERSTATTSRRLLTLTTLIVSLATIFRPVSAQDIGTTICACSPSVYTFQFNFTYTCDQTNVEGPGVADWDCFSQGLGAAGDGVTDFVPVRISSVDVIELDQSLAPIGSSFYGAGYTNGDIIRYVSVAGNPSNVTSLTPAQIPRAIQLSIVGTNAAEEDITNVWIILFDNDCGFFQVLQDNDQIGWTKLLGLEAPLEVVCPAASQEPTTSAPTTAAPTTLEPVTEAPTIITAEPTTMTAEPTISDAPPPTTPETDAPSRSPVTRRPTMPTGIVTCPPTQMQVPVHKQVSSSKSIGGGYYSGSRGSKLSAPRNSDAVSGSGSWSSSGGSGSKQGATLSEPTTGKGAKRAGKGQGKGRYLAGRHLSDMDGFYEQRVGDHMSMPQEHNTGSSKGAVSSGSSSTPGHYECVDIPRSPTLPNKKEKATTGHGGSKRGSKIHMPVKPKPKTTKGGKGRAAKAPKSSKGRSQNGAKPATGTSDSSSKSSGSVGYIGSASSSGSANGSVRPPTMAPVTPTGEPTQAAESPAPTASDPETVAPTASDPESPAPTASDAPPAIDTSVDTMVPTAGILTEAPTASDEPPTIASTVVDTRVPSADITTEAPTVQVSPPETVGGIRRNLNVRA